MSGEIQKQFLLTSKIGNGNFSIVYLAKHIQSQQIVAVKKMKTHIPIAIKQAQLLKKMNHPNVIKLYRFQKCKSKDQAMIVLQYIPQNILQLYEAQQYGLKQDQVKCILFQCCLGLNHIHKRGIIHRDIKPQNIMINRNKAQVKLIDFGLAIEQMKCTTDYVATRWYRAPQNLLGTKQYTVAIDIFSLGCVIVELYLGNPLFPGSNNLDQVNKILSMLGQPTVHSWKKGYEQLLDFNIKFQLKPQRKRVTLRNLLSSCSQGLFRIVQKMLILNPKKRISAQQILRDSYFNDVQKIVPPHVYDQYLIDIKKNKIQILRQAQDTQKKHISKQRIRFLSQQKGFGAFSSFKSATPLNKLNYEMNKLSSKIPNQSNSPRKQIHSLKSRQNQFLNSPKIEKLDEKEKYKSSYIQMEGNIQQKNRGNDLINKITQRNSLEKFDEFYQKNSPQNNVKISSLTNLNNLKSMKNSVTVLVKDEQVGYNNDKKLEKSNSSADNSKNINIIQALSFRGFNQPKQKMSIKQYGTNIPKKTSFLNSKSNQIQIKSQKVIEYLQRIQNKQRFQPSQHKLEASKSQSIINPNNSEYKSLINRKPSIVMIQDSKTPLTINQTPQKFVSKISLTKSNSKPIQKERQSFYLNSGNSEKNLFGSFYRQPSKIYPQQKNIMLRSMDSIKINHYNPNKIQNSMHLNSNSQKILICKSPNHNEIPKRLNEVSGVFIKPSQNFQPITNQSQNSARRLINKVDVSQFGNLEHSIKNSKILSSQILSFPESTSFEVHQIQQNIAYNKNLLANSSSNRTIQNKINLIAVRENFPHNNDNRNSSAQNSLKNSTEQLKLTLNSNNTLKSSFDINNNKILNNSINIGSIQRNKPSSVIINSPRRQQGFLKFQNNLNQICTQQIQNKNQNKHKMDRNNQEKAKFFRSLEHPQFFTKKGVNRYSVNTNDEVPDIYDESMRNLGSQTKISGMVRNKAHQTTLSQLRQSITGIAPTFNEGGFRSQRLQKGDGNKNININVNLNIYQKRSPRNK